MININNNYYLYFIKVKNRHHLLSETISRLVEENFKMGIGKCIWIRIDTFCYFNWLDYRFDWCHFDVIWEDF